MSFEPGDAPRPGQALLDAEQTGLHPDQFNPSVRMYLAAAESASDFGDAVTFIGVTGLALIGVLAVTLLVRKPPTAQPEAAAEGQCTR